MTIKSVLPFEMDPLSFIFGFVILIAIIGFFTFICLFILFINLSDLFFMNEGTLFFIFHYFWFVIFGERGTKF